MCNGYGMAAEAAAMDGQRWTVCPSLRNGRSCSPRAWRPARAASSAERPAMREPCPDRHRGNVGAERRISHVKRRAGQITARDGGNGGSSPPIADSVLGSLDRAERLSARRTTRSDALDARPGLRSAREGASHISHDRVNYSGWGAGFYFAAGGSVGQRKTGLGRWIRCKFW